MTKRDDANDRVSRRVTIELPSEGKKGDGDAASPSASAEPTANHANVIEPDAAEGGIAAIDHAISEHADELLKGEFDSLEEEVNNTAGSNKPTADAEDGTTQQPVNQADGANEGSAQPGDGHGVEGPADGIRIKGADQSDADESSVVDNGSAVASADGEMIPAADIDQASTSDVEVIPTRESSVEGDEADVNSAAEEELPVVSDSGGVENNDDPGERLSGEATDEIAGGESDRRTAGEHVEGEVSSAEPEQEAVGHVERTIDAPVESSPVEANVSKESNDVSPAREEKEKDKDKGKDKEKSSPVATVRRVAGEFLRRAGHWATSVLLAVLTVMSKPLEMLPPSLRPMADWLALSLIFWVPIVWVLMLLMS